MTLSRQDALAEIADIAKRHALTLADIAAALQQTPEQKAERSGSLLMRIFGYIGGILVVSGLCIFVGMQWDHIGPAARVMLTLGVGFCVFVMAITCAKDEKLEVAATPLFLLAALLQPGGIFVVLDIFSRGGDPAHGVLFMSLVMLAQQGFTFMAMQRTVLAFTSIFFGLGFCTVAFDLLGVPDRLNGLVISSSLLFIGWALNTSRHKALAPLIFFFGSLGLFCVVYDILERHPAEILFLGVSCGIIFLATLARSRVLLVNGTLATLGYIGHFTEKYFANSLGWPITLILMGLVFIGLGVVAVKINRKYIKQG